MGRISRPVARIACLAGWLAVGYGQSTILVVHRVDRSFVAQAATTFDTAGGEAVLVLGDGFGANASAVHAVTLGDYNCTIPTTLPWNASALTTPGGVTTIRHPTSTSQPWLNGTRR